MWQLDRLAARRAANATVAASLAAAPIDAAAVISDSVETGRRVMIRGTYDFDSELVLVNRSRDGAPGVNVLTPLRIAGRDTAILVNRGWVYSPDGGSIDRSRWRESPEASALGYILWPTLAPPGTAASTRVDSTRSVLRADPARVAASIGYPVAPFQVVLLGDSVTAAATTAPRRLSPPPLDEGPHRSYAIQWFSFAAVVVFGTAALLRGETRTGRRSLKDGREAGREEVEKSRT